jgi:hypothetical protein
VVDLVRLRRRHFHARRAKAHGKLAGHEIRAAVLGDLQPVQRNPVLQAPSQPHHAIDHELHEIVIHRVGKPAFGLRCDDGAHLVVRQPVADAVDLAHFGGRVAQQRQQDVDAVEDDPARAELVLFRLQHGEHALQVEIARVHHLGREARVEEEQPLLHQGGQVPVEGCGVGGDLRGGFFERDEQAALFALARGVDQALHGEGGLARARAALQQRGPLAR